jgi:hypothetical protein
MPRILPPSDWKPWALIVCPTPCRCRKFGPYCQYCTYRIRLLAFRSMNRVLASLISTVLVSFRSRGALQAEILALRHQINILRRSSPKRPYLRASDRILWVRLSRLWPNWCSALLIVKPETVIRWHRQSFRLYWRRKSRHLGRPDAGREVRELIRKMCASNPSWGAPRIHGEVLTAPRSPWQSPYVKRLIGSIRRECLDHLVVLGEKSLQRILRSYIEYYHDSRCLSP